MHFTSCILLFLFVFVCCCGASPANEPAIITELKNDFMTAWIKPSEFFNTEAKIANKNLQVLRNRIAGGFNKSADFLSKESTILKNVLKNGNITKQFFEREGQAAENNIIQDFNATEKFLQKEYGISENKIEEIFTDIEKGWNASGSGCTCEHYSCGCCSHLELAEIELNATICVNLTYLAKDYGVSFTVTLNHYTLYNETVSARNPPPVCIGMPYVKELAEVCIALYNINATSTTLHACVRVEARMKRIRVAKYELGCFTLGPPGIKANSSFRPIVRKTNINTKPQQTNINTKPQQLMIAHDINRSVNEVKQDKVQNPEKSSGTILKDMVTMLFMGGIVLMMLVVMITRSNMKIHGYISGENQKLLV